MLDPASIPIIIPVGIFIVFIVILYFVMRHKMNKAHKKAMTDINRAWEEISNIAREKMEE